MTGLRKVTAATGNTGDGSAGQAWNHEFRAECLRSSMPARDAEAATFNAGDPVASLPPRGRTLVLGIGSTLAGDDAFGPAVLRAISAELAESNQRLPDGVELADGGILGIDLLSDLEEIDRLILVDAVRPAGASERTGKRGRETATGGATHWGAKPAPVPGEVVVFRLGEVELADPDPRFSLHDLSFGACLRLAAILGLRLPRIDVVGFVLPPAGETPPDPPPHLTGPSMSAPAGAAVLEAARAVRSLLP